MSNATISVIVPALDAADTIERTLGSVVAQTSSRWEVVVIDDGSTDETAALISSWRARDTRIRMIESGGRGVSAARNAGLKAATGRWVLFLDADDVIEPGYVAAALDVLGEDPGLDGVRCRSFHESSTGRRALTWDMLSMPGATLRATTRRICPLDIHACVLSKDLVESVGGFDESLAVAEDWDLWLRLGRADVRLATLSDAYAVYVLRPGSASRRDFTRVYSDSVRVLERANSVDLAPGHVEDPPVVPDDVDEHRRGILFWVLALTIGSRGDHNGLLAIAAPLSRLDLDSTQVADALFSAVPLGGGFVPEEWSDHWDGLEPHLGSAIHDFTTWVGAPAEARVIRRRLELRIAGVASGAERVRVGATLSVPVDLGSKPEPIGGLSGVDQVVLRVHHGTIELGRAEVAVLDDILLPPVIQDAIRHQLSTSTVRAALHRPAVGGLILRSLDPSRVVRQAALVALDLPARRGETRNQLFKAFTRNTLDGSARGATVKPSRHVTDDRHEQIDARYWEEQFETADPWDYTNSYEQRKYEQTLSLVVDLGAQDVLELACAEGHFTEQLAPHVGHVVATDISLTALERAATRCADHENVEFRPLDLTNDTIPTDLDLVLCSEVLYYYDRASVEDLAGRIRDALRPGGSFVTAHANLLVDDPHTTAFDWGTPEVTARVVREVFLATPGLVLERELGCELYRIMRFRRVEETVETPPPAPERIHFARPLDPMIDRMVVWGGFTVTRESSMHDELTDQLPVLMYHRVAEEGADDLARYRTSPEDFERQLEWLRRNGYYGVTLDWWWENISRRRPLGGRAVLLTFDDGYQDFYENAWPLLEAYGFPATVFIVADDVGGTARWDTDVSDPAPLMDWPTIRRLATKGIDFGSHTGSHRALTGLAPRDALAQERAARAVFERELGRPLATIAYPFGSVDEVVRQTMRAAGYQLGVQTNPGLATVWDDPMAIPRLEVRGDRDLTHFIDLLAHPSRRGPVRKGLSAARQLLRRSP